MRRGDAFKSNYIKTEDLQGREHLLTIDTVEIGSVNNQETGKPEDKAIIFFKGKNKGMVLNVTNWDTLEEMYGEDSDDWQGCPMILYPTTCRFGNKKVDCMRIKIPKGSELNAPGHDGADIASGSTPPSQDEEPPPPSDEDIPF
jgi:hypothetical protein